MAQQQTVQRKKRNIPNMLTKGVFGNMKFPDYQFREFPKHIPVAKNQDGSIPPGAEKDSRGNFYLVVDNIREEMAARAEYEVLTPKPDAVTAERDELALIAGKQAAEIAELRKQLAESAGAKIVNAQTGSPAKVAPSADTAKGVLTSLDELKSK